MTTASNGIKIVNGNGEKMDEETLLLIEDYIDGKTEVPVAERDAIGRTVDYVAGRNRYIGYLVSLAKYSFKDVKVGLDVANGAAWSIAKAVFDALGAQTYVMNDNPDGYNINTDCGSTHIEHLQKPMTATQTAACAWMRRVTSSPATTSSTSTACT